MIVLAAILIAIALVVALVAFISYGLSSSAERQRQEVRRRVQAAERDIAEIGRLTRQAIMDDAIRRTRQGRP